MPNTQITKHIGLVIGKLVFGNWDFERLKGAKCPYQKEDILKRAAENVVPIGSSVVPIWLLVLNVNSLNYRIASARIADTIMASRLLR